MPRRDDLDPDRVLSDAVRRAYVRPVDDDVAAQHVTQLVAAAQAGGTPARPVARPGARRRLWRPALAAALGALLLPVALAAAGVNLPDPIDAPYHDVGITLPHQSRDAASPPRVAPTVSTTPVAPSARPVVPPARRAAAERRKRAARAHARRRAHRHSHRAGTPTATQTGRPATTPARRGNAPAVPPGQARKGTNHASNSPTRKPTRPIIPPGQTHRRPHPAKPKTNKQTAPKQTGPPPQAQGNPQNGNSRKDGVTGGG